MEQNQNNSKIITVYPPLVNYVYPPLNNYAYPPLNNGDIMATNYFHSLTSKPYYYFTPHCNNPFGYYPPNPHYAYNTSICILPSYNNNNNNNNVIIRPAVLQETGCADYIQGTGDYNGNAGNSEEHLEARRGNQETFDPRIINILEPFRQLYSEREETLKTIFPGIYSKLSEFFKKVNSLMLEHVQLKGQKSTKCTLKRSLSLGDESNCKIERFKVKPIDSEDTLTMSIRNDGNL
ncbi:hypothetical protein RND81_09G032900 [Saponaria officinalis]|uniref:Uncharacterized protein n=1 Tax=Saponaria officinalis TaxID=3572 RepID=A0AAW1IH03_SAPOF